MTSIAQAVTLPSGFIDSMVGTGWNQPTGMTFAADGRLIVWEKSGKVWTVENGIKSSTPLLDLSEEVGNWRDFGLLSVALHPDFLNNGYVYLLYVVDYYHLKNFGTASYNPIPANLDQFHDTIGRLVRYTARASDGFHSIDLSTRRVLIGESITTGFPILHQSHGVGTVMFGTDGTLLASCGDGASYDITDTGGPIGGSTNTGLTDGIIDQKQDVGAFRSQLVDSLNGKVVRIDSFTGDGVPSNPFYDPAAPRAARSRVWNLGLRNPYRMTIRPNTGSHVASDGNPGVIYIGDVGWNTYEELDVSRGPAANFGWPAYEGLTAQSSYMSPNIADRDAPNPLNGTTPSGQPPCTQPYFFFKNLIVQQTLNVPSFSNPCLPSQQIPGALHTFMHTRPVLEWKHGSSGPARTGIFDGSGIAQVIGVGAAGSPVTGNSFGGNCSTGGVWYTATDFPADYQNTYFHAEYGQKWIKNFIFDASDRPVQVRDFVPDGSASVVALATSPIDGGLYFIDYASDLHRITYVGGGNKPPLAKAVADVGFGASPLTVHLTGSGSSDPEMGPLTYDWDFGDGSAHGTVADLIHVFTGVGPQGFTVTLTVTDVSAATSTTTLLVSINNTPPSVSITNPVDGTLYSMAVPTIVDLTASISDAEQGPGQRSCEWQTILHHNNHTHPEAGISSCTTTSEVTPVGCDGNAYWYEFQLTVTDAAGLSTTKSVSMYPDCSCTGASLSSSTGPNVTIGAPVHLTASAICGGEAEYRYWLKTPTAPWTIVQDYGSAAGNAYDWDTTAKPAGDYAIQVWIRGLGSAATYQTFATSSFHLSPPACTAVVATTTPATMMFASGTMVTVSGAATCPGTAQYRFYYQKPDLTWTMVQDYSTASTYSWNTTGVPNGPYSFQIWVRNVGSGASYEAYDTIKRVIGEQCTTVSVTSASPATITSGTPVAFTATAGCASGTPEYRFWMQYPGSGWTMKQDYGPSTTYNWNTTGLPDGSYALQVWTRTVGSSASYEAFSTIYRSIGCMNATLTSSSGFVVTPSSTVQLTGAASCGSPAEYRFWMRPPGGAWSIVQDYGSSSVYNWNTTGLPSGVYSLQVWIRSAGSSDSYQSYATLSHQL